MGEALSGRATLVLLHAAGLDHRMWDETAAAWQERGHDTLALDLAGHGTAPAPRAGCTLDDLADDVLERLPARDGPVVLVGVSLGGMVGQLCALRGTAAVDGLVLANTMAHPTPPMRDALRGRASRTEERGVVGMVDETIDRWFSAETRERAPESVARVRQWLTEADTAVNAGTWRAIADLATLERLPKLDLPVLVVSGSVDASVPAAVTAEMCAALSDVRHVELAGVGHLAPVEAAARFVTEVDTFVRESLTRREIS
ncbi:MAG: alpha/beta fold hydrolase [Streptosporangiales bacterium]|nr:alpha/beta fold hydrolase [Streptosporangiales bacterium]